MKKNLTFSMIAITGLLLSCNEVKEDNVDSAQEVREMASADTAVMYEEDALRGGVLEADEEEFKKVNFDSPALEEPSLKAAKIEVRGSDNYKIYSVGEDIMFDLDKAKLRPEGEKKLQEIAKSLKNKTGLVRVYGFTDSLASEKYNKDLAMARAKSVEDWLMNNSGLDTSRIRLVPVGENLFEATNKTAKGRQQNRRVEIVMVEKNL